MEKKEAKDLSERERRMSNDRMQDKLDYFQHNEKRSERAMKNHLYQ